MKAHKKISFLGIPKVGEKQWTEKEERKPVLTMASYACERLDQNHFVLIRETFLTQFAS